MEREFLAGEFRVVVPPGFPYWIEVHRKLLNGDKAHLRFHHAELDDLEYAIKKAKHYLREVCGCTKELTP